MSEPLVVLTSYSVRKQDSIDTYFHEWKSIQQSQGDSNSQETEEDVQDRDDQGIYTNPEAILLEKLGFGSYVSQLETGESNDEAEDTLLSNAGLTKHHAHAIRRRMDTLRSTVKLRKNKQSIDERGQSELANRSAGLSAHIGSKASGTVGTSPSSSPQASPSASRRSPTSYRPERRLRRDRNPDLDSGVYSANSSRDGTPIRGAHAADPGSSGEPMLRPRRKAMSSHSPKHRSSGGFEQNGVLGTKYNRFSDIGEGTYLDGSGAQSRITPTSLNLVSKPVEPENKRNSIEDLIGDPERLNVRVKRSSSDRPLSPSRSKHEEKVERETKSLTRVDKVRSLSPSSDSTLDSPEDVNLKLHFGSPAHNGVSSHNTEADELPNFMVSPDALGITRIQDLSLQDMERVRGVALLELTVTFDDHDISLRARRPAKAKNYPDNALRGVPLSVLLQADQKRDPMATIPVVFEEMISYLEAHALDCEGILRVPGSVSRINNLIQRMEESFHSDQFTFSGVNCNDISSVLKQFIRELPIPLLTREYLSAFASIADISNLKEQVRTLNLLILLLPDINQKVLKRLVEFFERIVQHCAINKMDLTNIAMVIAPNLFIKLPSRQNMDAVAMATKTSHVVRLLIKYHSLLWTIPGEMLRQIRYLYENEVRRLNPRSVQRAIKQMQHQLISQQPGKGITTPKVSHHIIRVKAPLFTRVCMAVDICVGVTAGDIVTKLQKKSRLNQDVIKKRFSSSFLLCSGTASSPVAVDTPDNSHQLKLPEELRDAGQQFLYEVGGNIGERCLPNDTDMYSLYSVNPNAQWIIKPRNCPDLN